MPMTDSNNGFRDVVLTITSAADTKCLRSPLMSVRSMQTTMLSFSSLPADTPQNAIQKFAAVRSNMHERVCKTNTVDVL